MANRKKFCVVLACLLGVIACKKKTHTVSDAPPSAHEDATEQPGLRDRAKELSHRFIIVDGHIDVPYRLHGKTDDAGRLLEDVSEATKAGDFDFPRAREGGLDAPFFSIYVPASYQKDGGAKKLADELIDMVEGIVKASPDKFALAPTPSAVRENFKAGKISLAMGIENGAALLDDLANVAHFHGRGVRYITLTHSEDNLIADSSYDKRHTLGGLSDFGDKVVREMNRVGIMIDISHVSDDAFYQAIKVSQVPVIASHSSCRHFTPGFQRNMGDEMIRALAKVGGVIMINFGSSFLHAESNKSFGRVRDAAKKFAQTNNLRPSDSKVKEFRLEFTKEHPPVFADIGHVADHIDHVVKLVGIEHVGLGSDFDGVGDSLPIGLKDVSQYANLIHELLKRGYKDADIEKLCGENVLRVWQAVLDHARAQGSP